MIHALWGLLWWLLVSAVIVVIVLLAMLLLAACAKPAPLSPPLATPTAVVPDKGIIRPEVGPSHSRLQGVTSRDEAPRPLAGPSELLWRGLVVYDLNEPAFPAGDSATKAARTFLGCEVRAWIAVMGNMPKDAVGAAGERGGPQVHPSWRQTMAGMGLELEIEQDRWTFALWLAENSGWSNWAYCQHSTTQVDGVSGEW